MAIETGFDIPAIEISTFELTLVGDSPLIVHAWSEKAKKEILDKQMKMCIRDSHSAFGSLMPCRRMGFFWMMPGVPF